MIRNRPPTIVPGVKAPRSSASEVWSRPTDDGGRGGFGTGAGPDSVGRRDSGPSSCPQNGQKRPESGTSDPQREHRVTMPRGYLKSGGLPVDLWPFASAAMTGAPRSRASAGVAEGVRSLGADLNVPLERARESPDRSRLVIAPLTTVCAGRLRPIGTGGQAELAAVRTPRSPGLPRRPARAQPPARPAEVWGSR